MSIFKIQDLAPFLLFEDAINDAPVVGAAISNQTTDEDALYIGMKQAA